MVREAGPIRLTARNSSQTHLSGHRLGKHSRHDLSDCRSVWKRRAVRKVFVHDGIENADHGIVFGFDHGVDEHIHQDFFRVFQRRHRKALQVLLQRIDHSFCDQIGDFVSVGSRFWLKQNQILDPDMPVLRVSPSYSHAFHRRGNSQEPSVVTP